VAEVVNKVIEEFNKADRIVAVEAKLENVMEK
jgi:hypothetical protein